MNQSPVENPYEAPQIGGGVPDEIPGQILAGRGARLGAWILDKVFGFFSVAPGMVLLFWFEGTEIYVFASTGFGVMVLGALLVGGLQIVLLCTRGQTLGKMIVGAQIVNYDDGKKAGFVRAFLLRYVVAGLVGIVPLIGLFWPIIDGAFILGEERRCVHDHIAGTMVVEVSTLVS